MFVGPLPLAALGRELWTRCGCDRPMSSATSRRSHPQMVRIGPASAGLTSATRSAPLARPGHGGPRGRAQGGGLCCLMAGMGETTSGTLMWMRLRACDGSLALEVGQRVVYGRPEVLRRRQPWRCRLPQREREISNTAQYLPHVGHHLLEEPGFGPNLVKSGGWIWSIVGPSLTEVGGMRPANLPWMGNIWSDLDQSWPALVKFERRVSDFGQAAHRKGPASVRLGPDGDRRRPHSAESGRPMRINARTRERHLLKNSSNPLSMSEESTCLLL